MADLSVIILTYNEHQHIERCIRSVQRFAREVFVVDSFSTDETVALAEALGARVVQNPWSTQAQQFNWALDHLPIATQWIMRMDADEYVLPELAEEIERRLPGLSEGVTGVNLKRRVFFMRRWIRYGGYYPTILLRIFRTGHARSEQRLMDEHIRLLDGQAVLFEHDIVDENLNDLTWWTDKHNRYASREAADLLLLRHRPGQDAHFRASTPQAERKRWLKTNVYARFPFGLRPLLYFLYRYIFRLGFLDGRPGLIWHTLQGFWYRFLVDAKLLEMERLRASSNAPVERVLEEHYGITPPAAPRRASEGAAVAAGSAATQQGGKAP